MLGGDFIKYKVSQYGVDLVRKFEGLLDKLDEKTQRMREEDGEISGAELSDNNSTDAGEERKRENLQKNFLQKDTQEHDIEARNISMKKSQGTTDYSGSAYNGPGNVDHEKVNSNMQQRNFENHQGN